MVEDPLPQDILTTPRADGEIVGTSHSSLPSLEEKTLYHGPTALPPPLSRRARHRRKKARVYSPVETATTVLTITVAQSVTTVPQPVVSQSVDQLVDTIHSTVHTPLDTIGTIVHSPVEQLPVQPSGLALDTHPVDSVSQGPIEPITYPNPRRPIIIDNDVDRDRVFIPVDTHRIDAMTLEELVSMTDEELHHLSRAEHTRFRDRMFDDGEGGRLQLDIDEDDLMYFDGESDEETVEVVDVFMVDTRSSARIDHQADDQPDTGGTVPILV